jgi:hypothetical protein
VINKNLFPSAQEGRWYWGEDGRSHYSHDLSATVGYCGIAFKTGSEQSLIEDKKKMGRCAECADQCIRQGSFDSMMLEEYRREING